MKTVAIVQARMGSTRLPGKVLLDLAGEPMLARVVSRLRRARRVDAIVVATSTLASDAPIVELCAARGWACFRGSEDDVLDRYAGAARSSAADIIVRITSDCPLIDPGVVDEVCAAFAGDYACNFHPRRTFPRGLDTEVFSRAALERCHREATAPGEREHVTAYIYRHPEFFDLRGVTAEGGDWSGVRWTVDTPADWAAVQAVYRHFGHDAFTWHEALEAWEAHPAWHELNRHVEQKAH